MTPDAYAALIDQVRDALGRDIRPVLRAARERLAKLVARRRFEEPQRSPSG
ncbi:MAG: hypothetical protein R2719_01600 [Micropruina sp.]